MHLSCLTSNDSWWFIPFRFLWQNHNKLLWVLIVSLRRLINGPNRIGLICSVLNNNYLCRNEPLVYACRQKYFCEVLIGSLNVEHTFSLTSTFLAISRNLMLSVTLYSSTDQGSDYSIFFYKTNEISHPNTAKGLGAFFIRVKKNLTVFKIQKLMKYRRSHTRTRKQ